MSARFGADAGTSKLVDVGADVLDSGAGDGLGASQERRQWGQGRADAAIEHDDVA